MNKQLQQTLRLFAPFLGLIFVYVIFYFIAGDSFSSLYNTKTILTQAVIIGIGALGMTLVIISAGIDLSVGSQVALGTVVTALILRHFGGDDIGLTLPLIAAMGGILACALCGFINGMIIAYLGIVPFIVTLGMMQVARGGALGLAGQSMVNTRSNWLGGMMVVEPTIGAWYSVAPGVWIMLVLLVLLFFILRYTLFGRYVFAIGSSEATARLCGIRVGFHRVCVYTICGAFTGVAAIMQYANLGLGDPTSAVGMELDIIAAVVIGGGSLRGGQGSALGSVIGALIMAVLRNGCMHYGIPNYVQNIVIGIIIVLAVAVDRLRQRNADA